MLIDNKVIKGWILNNTTQELTLDQLIEEINDEARNKQILKLRAEPDRDKQDEMKRELSGICWQAQKFIGGKRNSKSAVPSGLVGCDCDAKDNPDMGNPREYFMNYIYPIREELHLILAYVSTRGKGLQLVCHQPLNATIPQAQAYIAKKIGLKHDASCSNLDRVFIVPGKDDFLYTNFDELFAEVNPNPYTIDLTEIEEASVKNSDTIITQEMIDKVRNREKYGVKAGAIFDTYVGTKKIPEGQRNTVVFAKAHKLMAAGFTQDELVTLFSNVTDLSQAELNQACRWQPNYVPSDGKLPTDLRRIVRQLREEAGLETGVGLLPCRPMPKKLPAPFAVMAAIAPKHLCIPFIILSLPIWGAIATRVRFTYLDGIIHSLAFMAHVVGQFAGGKSTIIQWLTNHLLTSIRERDAVGRQAEREYVEAMKKCKADERKPDDPKPVIREIPVTISIAALLKRFDQSQGQTLISVCDEIDAVNQTNRAGAWSDKTVILRKSFDRGEVGQDYLSENSYSGIFIADWNNVSGGTDESTRKFYGKHVMDGLVSRVAFTRIESDCFAEEMPRLKALTTKQETILKESICAMEAAEGEISIPRISKAIERWLTEKRKLAMETMSYAINALYKRSAVMGARAGVIAYILCGYRETNVVINFALWVADYVLQQQVAMWGSHFENENTDTTTPVANLYKELPEEFTREELVNLRVVNGQGTNVRMIIKRWKDNGMIQELEQNRYVKTDKQA